MEFSAATRTRNLAAMAAASLDVLVIGGGITGAGVALEAASRGLSVGLIEREDFASGTSGRSSREIHGGLRYLSKGQLRLVRESLVERRVLLSMAPHLVEPLPVLLPARSRRERALFKAGLLGYDALAWGHRGATHRLAPENEVARMTGGLMTGRSAYLTYEGLTDDARLTLEVIRQAAARGALVANHTELQALRADGPPHRANVEDRVGGERGEVRARTVVNATGVWADRVQQLAASNSIALQPSKGVHLVFDRAVLPLQTSLVIPSVLQDSYQFLIPWGSRVYAGTTDTPYEGDLGAPSVDGADAEVIIASINEVLPVDLGPDNVVASWAGIRPLLAAGSSSTRDLSRGHIVVEDPPGVVTITGGKLTTFRVMARDTITRVLQALGQWREPEPPVRHLGLSRPLDVEVGRATDAVKRLGLGPDAGRRLVRQYGDEWGEAFRILEDDPEARQPLAPGYPVLAAEVVMARRREMAITAADILVRRTRLASMDAATAAGLEGTLG